MKGASAHRKDITQCLVVFKHVSDFLSLLLITQNSILLLCENITIFVINFTTILHPNVKQLWTENTTWIQLAQPLCQTNTHTCTLLYNNIFIITTYWDRFEMAQASLFLLEGVFVLCFSDGVSKI